jgi:hypothetical protein
MPGRVVPPMTASHPQAAQNWSVCAQLPPRGDPLAKGNIRHRSACCSAVEGPEAGHRSWQQAVDRSGRGRRCLRARAQAGAAVGRRCQPCDSPDQVTVRPPRRRQPHRAPLPVTSCRPPLPSASRSAGPSSGTPGAAAAGDLHPDNAVPALIVTVSPGTPGRLCRSLLPDSSLTSSAASAPHGCPGPVTPAVNARATRARSAHPATVTLTWTAASAISAPPSRRPAPRKQPGSRGGHRGCRPGSAAHVKPETRRRRGPSVAVRGKPTVHTDRPSGRTPSAMRPWTTRHAGPRRDKKTHGGTRRKRPA